MDVFQAIAQRHSYREAYLDRPVPREDLIRIVQAGIQAPSGKNEQTTSFVIVDDPQLLDQIASWIDKPVCKTAQAMIACVIDPRPVLNGISFAVEDCAAAVENMLLAITALGYASVWLDGVLRRDEIAQKISRLLHVPADKTVRVLLPVGVPAKSGTPKEKLPFEQRAWFNRYGASH